MPKVKPKRNKRKTPAYRPCRRARTVEIQASGTLPPEDEGRAPVPPRVMLSSTPFCLTLHPSLPIFVAGTVDGCLSVGRFDATANTSELLRQVDCGAAASCRALAFSSDGNSLFGGWHDRSLRVLNCADQSIVWSRRSTPHTSGVTSLCVAADGGSADDCIFASGDDDGAVFIWDVRAPSRAPVGALAEHGDYISSLLCPAAGNGRVLLSGSGDGSIGAIDLRKMSYIDMCDVFRSEEVLSMCVIEPRNTVVAGTASGRLLLFDWGKWGAPSDGLRGHPPEIEAVISLCPGAVATGSGDSAIRAITLSPKPHRLRDVLHLPEITEEMLEEAAAAGLPAESIIPITGDEVAGGILGLALWAPDGAASSSPIYLAVSSASCCVHFASAQESLTGTQRLEGCGGRAFVVDVEEDDSDDDSDDDDDDDDDSDDDSDDDGDRGVQGARGGSAAGDVDMTTGDAGGENDGDGASSFGDEQAAALRTAYPRVGGGRRRRPGGISFHRTGTSKLRNDFFKDLK